jgi:hypothetical protein
LVNNQLITGIITFTMNSEYVALVFRVGNAHRVMKNSIADKDTPEIKKRNTMLYNSAHKDWIVALQPHLFWEVEGIEYDAIEEEERW